MVTGIDDAVGIDQQQEEVQLSPAPHLPEPEAVVPPPDDAAAAALATAAEGEIPKVEAHHIEARLEVQAHAEAQTEVHVKPKDLAPPAAPRSVLEEDMIKIRSQQVEQTQLIVNMQVMINNLSAKQSELEEEIEGLKGGRWIVKAEPTMTTVAKRGTRAIKERVNSSQALITVGGAHTGPSAALASGIDGATTDDDIDAIIQSRKERKLWPLKRKYATCFTQEFDLLRLRFHHSEKYPHKSMRIPKVDKNEGYGLGNKEGRLICRLCSGKTINRNTSWMCYTCLVPLCVDISNGDPESSCHARWHGCQDLVVVNTTLNTALRERRESKKRSRDSNGAVMAMLESPSPAVAAVEKVVKQPKTDDASPNIMEEIHQHEAVVMEALPVPEPMVEVQPQQVLEEQPLQVDPVVITL